MRREGVCISCHQEIPEGSAAIDLLHHVAAATGTLPEESDAHSSLVHKIVLTAAWTQVGGGILAFLGTLFGVVWWRRRRRARSRVG